MDMGAYHIRSGWWGHSLSKKDFMLDRIRYLRSKMGRFIFYLTCQKGRFYWQIPAAEDLTPPFVQDSHFGQSAQAKIRYTRGGYLPDVL